jgi:hypothetical protein
LYKKCSTFAKSKQVFTYITSNNSQFENSILSGVHRLVKIVLSGQSTTKKQNRLLAGCGGGMSAFAQAGRNISIPITVYWNYRLREQAECRSKIF